MGKRLVMSDSLKTAKPLLEGDVQMLIDAEERLGKAWVEGDEAAETFWRSVFRDYCALVDALPERDEVLQEFREIADAYAWGATPCMDDDL
jgi:hypothetical protein